MKLGTILKDGIETVIVKVGENEAAALNVDSMIALIDGGDAALDDANNAIEKAKAGFLPTIDVSNADWLAPVPNASKIIGCAVNNRGLNKVAHRPLESPMFFLKGKNALTGYDKPIKILERHGRLIPEPEPVAVFKNTSKDLTLENALDNVFGWTITNDVTASGIKFGEDSVALKQKPELIFPHHMNWRHRFGEEDTYVYFVYHARSKAADTFAAMGQWLTTADEVSDPNDLKVRSWVDGEQYVEDSTSSYLFSVERVIEEASTWFTLYPGDCLHFGTANRGVGQFPNGNLSVNLNEFDRCDIEIDGLGKLSNPIDSEIRKKG